MKKALLTAAILGFMVSSCKKNYTCECTETSSDPSEPASTYKYSTGKVKKKDAEAFCSNLESTYSFFGTTYTEKCELQD